MAVVANLETHVERPSPGDRQNQILDAFERCIVRSGFQGTTMQDVAAEVGMSVGNLYRYFDSKEALVSGMIGRDRARLRSDFEATGSAPDFLAAIKALGRKHLVEEPRERSMQIVEIWTQAMHNPKIAALCLGIEGECHGQFGSLLAEAKAAGKIQPQLETYKIVDVMMALGDGLLLRRALRPDFDAEAGFELMFSILNILLQTPTDPKFAGRTGETATDPK